MCGARKLPMALDNGEKFYGCSGNFCQQWCDSIGEICKIKYVDLFFLWENNRKATSHTLISILIEKILIWKILDDLC